MVLPIQTPFPPMEAQTVDDIPAEDGWQYEPKWDGFRCLAFRDGDQIELQSKAGQPLARYFPDVVGTLGELGARRFVLDGELVVPVDDEPSFDDLLLRLHPAQSRVRKLAEAHPATYIVFDLLVDERGRDLTTMTLTQRRERLRKFADRYFGGIEHLALSPATSDVAQARRWFGALRGGLDGVIAKRIDLPYQSGERTGMRKIKNLRTADCVVGGYRKGSGTRAIGSLLLGLYDEEGLLQHVGFTSSLDAKAQAEAAARIRQASQDDDGKVTGFTGRAPGGPSRWNRGKSSEWTPLPPSIVVEVQYDHFSGGRFRHGTKFLRWRPDKAPQQCTFEHIRRTGRSSLTLL